MLLLSFVSWWYGAGWEQVARSFIARQRSISAAFSVPQLVQTLFAPWRRIITYPGSSFEDKLRAWADNMFSRIIGFFVRIIVIFAANLVMLAVAILTVIEILIWPLLPIAIPGLLIAGFLA